MSNWPIVRVICDGCGNRDIATVTVDDSGHRFWNRRSSDVSHGDGWAVGDSPAAVDARLHDHRFDIGAVSVPLVVGRREVWCREHGGDWVTLQQLTEALAKGSTRRPAVIRAVQRGRR